jgi:DegV family protein with EDD domain
VTDSIVLVRILANPGANLPPELLERYDVAQTSTTIAVDGQMHDVRDHVTLADVDRWIDGARVHPYVLGTSAAEFVKCYLDMGATQGAEICVLTSSRKITQSYDAACSAARTLASKMHAANVAVVDSTMTDLGLGLPVLVAAKAALAGLPLPDVAAATEAMVRAGRFVLLPRMLDNLVRGGRASFLRGWLANVLGVRPLLSFVDGEACLAGKCSASAAPAQVLADWITKQIPPSGPVWIGVFHGDVPEDAASLDALLRERYPVEVGIVREISPAVYLHAGPRSLGAVVFPLADLPWHPPSD